jgi:hypothetical protein
LQEAAGSRDSMLLNQTEVLQGLQLKENGECSHKMQQRI